MASTRSATHEFMDALEDFFLSPEFTSAIGEFMQDKGSELEFIPLEETQPMKVSCLIETWDGVGWQFGVTKKPRQQVTCAWCPRSTCVCLSPMLLPLNCSFQHLQNHEIFMNYQVGRAPRSNHP